MAVDKFEAKHALVFNLSSYCGNYEREFCAFVIGATGECGVGERLAKQYHEDHPKGTPFYALSDRCAAEADDNGCHRPVSIYHDRDIDVESYESLIIFLDTVPTDAEMTHIISRAKTFCAERPDWKSYQGEIKPLTLKGAYLLSNKVERVQRVEKTFDVS